MNSSGFNVTLLSDCGVYHHRQTPPPAPQSSYLAAFSDAYSHIYHPRPSYATTTDCTILNHVATTHPSNHQTVMDYHGSRTTNHNNRDNNDGVGYGYISLSRMSEISNQYQHYPGSAQSPDHVVQYSDHHDNIDANCASRATINPIQSRLSADRSAGHSHYSFSPSSSSASTALQTPIVGSTSRATTYAQSIQIESIDQPDPQYSSSTQSTHPPKASSCDPFPYVVVPGTEMRPHFVRDASHRNSQAPMRYDPRYNADGTSSHPMPRYLFSSDIASNDNLITSPKISDNLGYSSAHITGGVGVVHASSSLAVSSPPTSTTMSTAASSTASSSVGKSGPSTTFFPSAEYTATSSKTRRPWPSKFEDQIFTEEDLKLPAVKRRRIYINSLEMHANLLYTLLEANGLVADQGQRVPQARNKPKDTKLSIVKCQHEINCLRRRSAHLNELIRKAESDYPTDVQLSPHPFSKELML